MAEENQKKGMSKGAKFGLGCLGIIVLFIIIGIATSGSKSSNSNTQSPTTTTPKTTTPTVKKFNIDDIYSQINTGMSEEEVEKIVTKKPLNCTESETQGLGTSKLCTYGNVFLDAGSIMVSYMNGKVFSKTKSQF